MTQQNIKKEPPKPTGVVTIGGKQYETVALRVHKFREDHPDWRIVTEIMLRDSDCVVMKAKAYDADDRVMATGHSEEYRSSSNINKTSALENAETSAIGRCLACLGYGGTEFASANEVDNAKKQQSENVGLEFLSHEQAEEIELLITKVNANKAKFLEFLKADSVQKIPAKDYDTAKKALEEKKRFDDQKKLAAGGTHANS